MTHMLIEDDLQTEIEARRMDLIRETWDDPRKALEMDEVYAMAVEKIGDRDGVISMIAMLTLAIERQDQ